MIIVPDPDNLRGVRGWNQAENCELADTGLSIDAVDVSQVPSLIGYWKCTDFDPATGLMPDHSQYGHDLTVALGGIDGVATSLADLLTIRPGWVSLGANDHAQMDITGTALDTLGKVVLIAGEMIYVGGMQFPLVAPDIDIGTSHDIIPRDPANGQYRGWMIGGAFEDNYFRVSKYAGGVTTQWKAPVTGGTVGPGWHVDAETPFVVAGSFFPGQAVYGSVGRAPVETTTISETGSVSVSTMTSVEAQNGRFAIRGVTAHRTSVRDVQVWSWDISAAPSHDLLKHTVEWMTYHPGKIPPWLLTQ